jgi:hypothetical protein
MKSDPGRTEFKPNRNRFTENQSVKENYSKVTSFSKFFLDFDVKENGSGTVVEKIRNAKYINEFFLIDFSDEPFAITNKNEN